MTVVALDDTDSRTAGMCTTYAAHLVAEELRAAGVDVHRILLVRLNPAVAYKTRGNAALAVHADVDPAVGLDVASRVVEEYAEVDDERTNPGVVVAHEADAPPAVAAFAERALREDIDPGEAESLAAAHGYQTAGWGNGRGVVGALAAVGAWTAFDDWTYESIHYRPRERWGTTRDVDAESVFAAADAAYPDAWDTVDRAEGDLVCVPHTPGPILYGIRGDDPETVQWVADKIDSERVHTSELFVTNQGTDAHLADAALADVQDGRAYRVDATVAADPETREGGHVFLDVEADGDRLACVAFEPTKRFRGHVRGLRPGDRVAVCGEVADGTLKLEKFAVRDLVTTERVTPTCPDCGTSMESAGADQGYRCRDCHTSAPGKERRPLGRDLDRGWYEVPPCARRHIARPLVRGEWDAPTHPER
ncbi:tRNA(Ile)(2)-agmatinylcytidine synthase [Halobacterium jilantaiense]|uniref:tRNA(Ile2) 2-agmatinylcytidine synthetase TiaS n=1 Tax=Halobacterium jilantaiense TaxID=355548 RepID=A0A1I0Q1Z1_9EURY|nr:tRNA(Ile)(2)-agmatinylcytidine synthase [Halobacterium jilantaiense]SEW20802.1 tRNA(Ile2) 2-agmatinylcytidine synthetase [Halobacterium jilantaiense]